MPVYSAANPAPNVKVVSRADGTSVAYPIVAIPNPMGPSFPPTWQNDPNSAPYVVQDEGAQGAAQKGSAKIVQMVGPQGAGSYSQQYDQAGAPVGTPLFLGASVPKAAKVGDTTKMVGGSLYKLNPDGSTQLLIAKPVVDKNTPTAPTATSDTTNTKNTAAANNYDAGAALKAAQTAAKIGGFAVIKPQLDAIDQAVKDGSMTAADAATAKQGIVDQAVKDAVSGMTSPQRATDADNIATNLANQASNAASNVYGQANNRASNAASIFNNTLSEVGKLNADLPVGSNLGGKGFIAALNMAPQFQSSMGGAPISGLLPQQQAALGMATSLAQKYGLPLGQAAKMVTNHITSSDSGSDGTPAGADGLPDPTAYTPNSPTSFGQPGNPYFTAPAVTGGGGLGALGVGSNPTLAAAGSGGM